jgi:hypothetical protein
MPDQTTPEARDAYWGQGGSYVANAAGERVLAERTDWEPPQQEAPVKKGKAAPAQPETTTEE